jgi:hypothetical protein
MDGDRWEHADLAHRALVDQLEQTPVDPLALQALGTVSLALELRALREHVEQPTFKWHGPQSAA